MKCICLLVLMIAVFTSCTSPSPQVLSTAAVTQAPSATLAIKPTKTDIPTATTIPGFEDWSVLSPQSVDIRSENGSLTLMLKHRALWFMEQRGVLVYKDVSGNFKITADVHTAKRSNPAQPPGGNGSVQLGGLMARNGNGGQENYVFIVVGDDGDGLSVETKNTTDSFSKYNGPAWGSADAELRLCRFGQAFNLYKRHINSNESWTLAASFDRPDMPDDLQVGINIYTDSAPDLQIRYDNIRIDLIKSQEACTTD